MSGLPNRACCELAVTSVFSGTFYVTSPPRPVLGCSAPGQPHREYPSGVPTAPRAENCGRRGKAAALRSHFKRDGSRISFLGTVSG